MAESRAAGSATSSAPAGALATFAGTAGRDEQARLEEVLPEIRDIHDPRLRAGVVAIWAHAWRAGRWVDLLDAHTIAELPRWNLVAHTRGVVRGALAIADALGEFSRLSFDRDVLLTVGLLHDVAKMVEFEPSAAGPRKSAVGETVHHATVGAQWALEAGLPPDIAQAIFSHTPSVIAMPRTPEGLIVQMVDHTLAEVTRKVDAGEAHAG